MRAKALALLLLVGCAAPAAPPTGGTGGVEPCPPTDLAGRVEQVRDGSLVLNATGAWNGTLVVRHTQATRWWDEAAGGCTAGPPGAVLGQTVRTDGGRVLTRSLPPQATAANVVRVAS